MFCIFGGLGCCQEQHTDLVESLLTKAAFMVAFYGIGKKPLLRFQNVFIFYKLCISNISVNVPLSS